MNKKGVSIMIGYVLLVSMAIVMSFLVYAWLKTYIPKDNLECPEDTSISIENVQCEGGILTISLKNNGLFNINGYIIRLWEGGAGGVEEQIYEKDSIGDAIEPNRLTTISLGGEGNSHSISYLEIVPIRLQEDEEEKTQEVICGNAKVNKEITSCLINIELE